MGSPASDAPLLAAPEAPALVARVALPIAVDELFDYAVPPELDAAARPGSRARVRLGRRRVVGVIVERAAAARFAGELRPLEEIVDAEPAIQGSLLAVVREEAAEILCPVGIALAAALLPARKPRKRKAPEKTGAAAARPAGAAVARDAPPALTSEQAKALDPIAAAVRAREARTFLLHGVTGSGKTEVYLRAVAEALAAGRQALVLVPEISLTHQIVMRLRARFGDALAILHSGLRPRERGLQWRSLREGAVPIAVGARSALFAPLEELGVIVIDEEHDGAYKNEEGFRYHARELAARRAAHAQCPLVLGSATPALETRFAADRGRIGRLVLPHRIGGRPLPAVEIVDLAEERRLLPRGRKLIFSRALALALRENLARGGQAILLLNRRGFSTRIFCFSCGHAERCENCDVALVFHAAGEVLRCHYCDLRRAPPAVCSGCGATDAALLGIGTERVEEALRQLLPEARIERLDRDSAARRGFAERVLGDLRDGRLDVVVGTQIVAKGHDFPGVRLVGVVLADVGLHLPDFRAAERTFQLLTQVAGRAGRDSQPGRVIIQTFAPQHYAIRPVREHDYEAFYAEELGHRAPLGYPPFGHLAHLVVAGPDEARTREGAQRLAAAARAAGRPVEVLGPAPAPLARLRGRHRQQVLVKGVDAAAVRETARAVAAVAGRLRGRLQATLDVRPQNML